MSHDWSPQQVAALQGVKAWYGSASKSVYRVFGFAGTGKAQDLDAKIQTPSGPVRMGQIRMGDEVFGRNGAVARVLGVYPQGVKPTYKVTFRDGTSTTSCADHLWTVTTAKDAAKGKWRTITLQEVMDAGITRPSGDMRWRVPICDPVLYPDNDLRIDPYVLGVLLGDGYLGGGAVIVTIGDADRDIADLLESRLPDWVSMSGRSAYGCMHFSLIDVRAHKSNEIKSHLRDMSLCCGSKEKYIPKPYLFGGVEQRKAILRGLMDTDGSCRGNRTSFSSRSPRLADDIASLVRSLGGVAIVKSYDRGEKGREYSVNVKVNFNPFLCARKSAQWKPSRKNPPSKCIRSVDLIGDRFTQCIQVSAGDGLYLTDDYIVTHNTTLARHFASEVFGTTEYVAYTGKAAMVMRNNGCDGAGTIHSKLYTFNRNKETGKLTKRINKKGPLATASLIVADECSMVDEEVGADLLSLGVPILALGDPAQLPPVKGGGFFTDHEPDHLLTEIHRQAEGNPIVKLATDVREGRMLELGQYGESRVIPKKDITGPEILACDQLIVGLNRTRHGCNRRVRELLGRKSWMPEAGDRIVCRKNDKMKGIYNGGLFTIDRVQDQMASDKADRLIRMEVLSEDFGGGVIKTAVREEFFEHGALDVHWSELKGTEQFNYGYALTVHTSQGSQWDNVIIFNESGSFRDTAQRWLYTGITRAAKKITICQ